MRRAFRAVCGAATLTAFDSLACVGRRYHRLNEDYRPLHALCRFFLDHTGPTHEAGDRQSLPFLVDMAGLFEQFVAAYLTAHLPSELAVRPQEPVRVGEGGALGFAIDLVLYRRRDRVPVAVLDTKYKAAGAATSADVSQVVTYAELKGCRDAFLIFPRELGQPLDARIGGMRVRSLAFSLEGDLEAAGGAFLRRLLAEVAVSFESSGTNLPA